MTNEEQGLNELIKIRIDKLKHLEKYRKRSLSNRKGLCYPL